MGNKRHTKLPTAERLREVLDYDPCTGVFTWKAPSGRRVKVGSQAGRITDGYRRIGVDGAQARAHRLAWLYVYGELVPDGYVIDHINGDRSDNRISNLRVVTHSVNMQNQRRCTAASKSGLLGVRKYENAWLSGIGVQGREIHLGSFKSPEAAHEAYLQAKRRLHEGCTI